jgi:hypothetical protein
MADTTKWRGYPLSPKHTAKADRIKRQRKDAATDGAPQKALLNRAVRRGTLVETLGLTNNNPDGSAMSKSRRKKRRLMASQGLNISFSQNYTESPTKRAVRKAVKHIKMLKRIALCSPQGFARPLSKLDAQAKSLGVYDDAYHCMNRTERKSIVSTALTKQRLAA